jgi:putative flippase GtrA
LYDFTFPRASPIVKFLISTGIGFILGCSVYALAIVTGDSRVVATAWGYLASILMTAVFHLRYVRTQAEFLITRHPWGDFLIISLAELLTCVLAAMWLMHRAPLTPALEAFLISFGCGTVVRYVLRKELLQDVRGLRRELRRDELS